MEFIDKKKFTKTELYKNIQVFVVYKASLILKMTIYLIWETQIVLLNLKKVIILAKYLDFTDLFLKKLAKVVPKQIDINKYAIK